MLVHIKLASLTNIPDVPQLQTAAMATAVISYTPIDATSLQDKYSNLAASMLNALQGSAAMFSVASIDATTCLD